MNNIWMNKLLNIWFRDPYFYFTKQNPKKQKVVIYVCTSLLIVCIPVSWIFADLGLVGDTEQAFSCLKLFDADGPSRKYALEASGF